MEFSSDLCNPRDSNQKGEPPSWQPWNPTLLCSRHKREEFSTSGSLIAQKPSEALKAESLGPSAFHQPECQFLQALYFFFMNFGVGGCLLQDHCLCQRSPGAGSSLVVQWLRRRLPRQGVLVLSPVWELRSSLS